VSNPNKTKKRGLFMDSLHTFTLENNRQIKIYALWEDAVLGNEWQTAALGRFSHSGGLA